MSVFCGVSLSAENPMAEVSFAENMRSHVNFITDL